MMERLVLGLGLAAVASAASAAPCGEQLDAQARHQIESTGLQLAYAPQPSPIPVDRHFQIDIAVCGAPVSALRVDADMPAHRHGMNYRTTVRALGDGRFEAQGLLFHMPGRWRLIFDIDTGGQTLRLTQAVEVR